MGPWISYLLLFFHDHWVRILLNFHRKCFRSKFKFFQPFSCHNGHFLPQKKNVLLSRHFRKVRRQIPQCFLFYLFLPQEDLQLHSCHIWNFFSFCWFHQNHPHWKLEKYHHYKTNDDFPYPIGEKLHAPPSSLGWTQSRHQLPFLTGDIAKRCWTMQNLPPFWFCLGNRWWKPTSYPKMLIFSHSVNFGRNIPSSLLHWQNGLGTAWPGREPEVKLPECYTVVQLLVGNE